MNSIIDFIASMNPSVLAYVSLLIGLVALFLVVRNIQYGATKKRVSQLQEEIKTLENELEMYARRNQRRLTLFKRVIEGFDQILDGFKGVINEEEQEESKLIAKLQGALPKDKEEKTEAEVVRIDKKQN